MTDIPKPHPNKENKYYAVFSKFKWLGSISAALKNLGINCIIIKSAQIYKNT